MSGGGLGRWTVSASRYMDNQMGVMPFFLCLLMVDNGDWRVDIGRWFVGRWCVITADSETTPTCSAPPRDRHRPCRCQLGCRSTQENPFRRKARPWMSTGSLADDCRQPRWRSLAEQSARTIADVCERKVQKGHALAGWRGTCEGGSHRKPPRIVTYKCPATNGRAYRLRLLQENATSRQQKPAIG